MKKQIALLLLGLVALTGTALADVSLIFNDNGAGGGAANAGNYAPGSSFSFDISISFTGPPPSDLFGVSLWFQSLQGASFSGGRFNVTGFNHSMSLLSDAQNSTFPQQLNAGSTGADNSFDLGASIPTGNSTLMSGTYFLGTITFQLTGAVAGQSYTLQNVFAPVGQPNAAHGSVASNQAGTQTIDIPSAQYFVTVIPEPSTWALVAVGAIGVAGAMIVRRKQAS